MTKTMFASSATCWVIRCGNGRCDDRLHRRKARLHHELELPSVVAMGNAIAQREDRFVVVADSGRPAPPAA